MQANYDNEIIDFEEINSVDEKELEILTKIQSVTESLQKQGLIEPNIQGSMLVIEWRKILKVSNLAVIPQISQMGINPLAEINNIDPYISFTLKIANDLIGAIQ